MDTAAARPRTWVQVLLADDYAFKFGDIGTRMFFIQRGYVQILSEDLQTVFCSLFAGSYFGELAMLTSQVLWIA